MRIPLTLGLLFCTACTKIDPVPFMPPPSMQFIGALEQNENLRSCEKIGETEIIGAEDVAVDDRGTIYAGTADGRIMTVGRDRTVSLFATTGGRPLGLDLDIGENLWVADARTGLHRIGPDGKIEKTITVAGGRRVVFADDVEVASDGKVYFSDASARWDFDHYVYDALEATHTGRLLMYDPSTDSTKLLLDNLYFANGVALSKNEDFVLVNETYAYRITRYWLSGEKAGKSEIFVNDLPGFPDGITQDDDGNFWAAIYMRRDPLLDFIAPLVWAKWLIGQLPSWAIGSVKKYGLAIKLDPDGKILESLHDPGGKHTGNITSAEPYGDSLYIGALHGNGVCRYPFTVKL